MENKKSLLQDSLQELENIKNESLELAKEQLINESADLLEKKSAELFEKLISEGEEKETEEEKTDKKKEEPSDKKEKDDDEGEDLEEPSDEEDDDEKDDEGDDEEKDEEDDEEDINFDDEDKDDEEEGFMSAKVDEKVLGESKLRNKKNMKNNKKEVLKDLRDVSFNKLVEAYYNMDESDSFVVSEEEMDEDYYEEGMLDEYSDDPYGDEYEIEDDPEFMRRMRGSKQYKPSSRELKSMTPDEPEYDPYSDVRKGGDYDDEELDEEIMYEIDMPENEYEEGYDLTDEEINEMLSEMDVEDESVMNRANKASGMDKMQDESAATDVQNKFVKQGISGRIASKSELEEMFEDMSMEELMEMEAMLEDDGGDMGESEQDGQGGAAMSKHARMKVNPEEDYMDEDAVIDEMLYSEEDMEEELEEGSAVTTRTQKTARNMGADVIGQGRPDRRSKPTLAEEEMEEVSKLHEKVKKLEKEKENLQEGFVNKIKLLENKVYDVTISALKAGFVNKFLLENPLRENEKTEIVYRFANAQTKEQIKETYISLTNEFAKRQIVKDGSMLNESVQNKVGKVHKTDNAIVREKNLINENDESNRFKQLLNYNFGKKK